METGLYATVQLELTQLSLGLFPCLQLLSAGGFGYKIFIMFIFISYSWI
jgi:nitrate reductase NapE component